jgi:phosphoribosylglycinamide formyltransferase-1
MKIGILTSRSGQNALKIIQAVKEGKINAEIALLIGNKCHSDFKEIMKLNSVDSLFLNHENFTTREKYDEALISSFIKAEVDLVVSCSFSRILTPKFIEYFPNSINSHPSLLPAFIGRTREGKKPVDAAIERGVKIIGATVHFIDKEVDNGPIIIQGVIPIQETWERNEIIKKVLDLEMRIKIQALAWYANGEIFVNNGIVSINKKKINEINFIDENYLIYPQLDINY